MLSSSLCTEASLRSPKFLRWLDRIRPAWDESGTGEPTYVHRKLWEWAFIAEALHERGVLRQGSRGIGFGVGTEPLSALFASLGCEIVATDVAVEIAVANGWASSGQHALSVEALNKFGICDRADFIRRTTLEVVDMNRIPSHLTGFDFAWSSCAFEHLGSIELGQSFILNQMRCLRPGGVAVHTTEFNVSSNDETIDVGQTVLFRRRDVDWIIDHLLAHGHLVKIDYDPGESPADRHVDVPPWSGVHLKLAIDKYVATSLGLIVEKSTSPARGRFGLAARELLRYRLARDHPSTLGKVRALRDDFTRVSRLLTGGGRRSSRLL